jgi:mannose-6-phosphate isomerase-like protein (cupin superfamily)
VWLTTKPQCGFSMFRIYKRPWVVACGFDPINAFDVMIAKIKGEYHWHKHNDIELHNSTITLYPGDLYVVSKGVQHHPMAGDEVHILLMETSGTPNSSDAATAAPRTLA